MVPAQIKKQTLLHSLGIRDEKGNRKQIKYRNMHNKEERGIQGIHGCTAFTSNICKTRKGNSMHDTKNSLTVNTHLCAGICMYTQSPTYSDKCTQFCLGVS